MLAIWYIAEPLLHSDPRLIGWSGSPSMLTTLPPDAETIAPQPTPQYGQIVVDSFA